MKKRMLPVLVIALALGCGVSKDEFAAQRRDAEDALARERNLLRTLIDHLPDHVFIKDAQGRYLLPDLPKAKYQIWVRGYGLVDSPKVESEPGKQLNLRAVPAPNEAAAAAYYPAIHWYTMMKVPDASMFGQARGDMPANIKQIDDLQRKKDGELLGK